MKDVDIKYEFTQFNGSFMQENVYRKPGSPEVDAAWEALGVDCKLAPKPALSLRNGDADNTKIEPASSPPRTAPPAA